MSLPRDVIDWVKKWDPYEVVNICAELVRIPSENPPGDVTTVADYVAAYLRDLGAKPFITAASEKKANVVATFDFGPGQCLIVNGHMDVVPAGELDKWEFAPFCGQITDKFVLGRGASDMKGGLAGLLVAIKELCNCRNVRGRILFMAVADEETGGWYGTRWLLERGYTGDACLIAEPTGLNPTIGQKGALWIRVKTHGRSAHGSLSPVLGDNAIIRMLRVIEVFYRLWEHNWPIPEEAKVLILQTQQLLREEGLALHASVLDRVTVNVGKISGGEKVNMVPSFCEAEFDLRVPIGVKISTVMDRLRGMLEQELKDEVELAPLGTPIEGNYTLPTHPFVITLLEAIAHVANRRAYPVLQWASSDARFFRAKGIPTAQFGPAEVQGIHGYNERVPISELLLATKVYLLVFLSFLRGIGGDENVEGSHGGG